MRDIERQARVGFQSSQVDKEANWEQAHLPKEKHQRRPANKESLFTTSEDEAEETAEPPKKKKKAGKKGDKDAEKEDKE